VARFLFGWLKALRWQRLPEMEQLGDTLVNHFDGIAAYCDHPVRVGVVESLNTTIKASSAAHGGCGMRPCCC
jgi:transposase